MLEARRDALAGRALRQNEWSRSYLGMGAWTSSSVCACRCTCLPSTNCYFPASSTNRYPREVSTIETLNMTETDKDELLRILESRGQQFLSAFASPVVMSKRKDVSAEDTRRAKKRRTMNQSEEEWSGIGSSSESEDSGESESEGSGAGESASSGGLQGIVLIDTL